MTRRRRSRATGALRLAALLAALSLAGCERGRPPASSWERMWHQRRADPYRPSGLFTDGKVMRPPPDGTVPHGSADGSAAVEPASAGAWPIAVSRAMLERGRDRFDIYCAACHGRSADGASPVAEFMSLRAPPSLLDDRIRRLQPAQIFTVITSGYGFMPSYAHALSAQDRWAVIAYVQVLQLRDRVPLDDLPTDLRRRAIGALSAADGAPAAGAAHGS